LELLVVTFIGEDGPEHMNHNFVDDWEAVGCMFRIWCYLLIEHVQKLAEELLELHIVVDLALRFTVLGEENLEVGVEYVVAEVCDEGSIQTEIINLDFVGEPQQVEVEYAEIGVGVRTAGLDDSVGTEEIGLEELWVCSGGWQQISRRIRVEVLEGVAVALEDLLVTEVLGGLNSRHQDKLYLGVGGSVAALPINPHLNHNLARSKTLIEPS